jgi:spore maturation protein CgeB
LRVAIVDTYYPAFQRRFYSENPGLERASYEEQHAGLLATWFGTADSYSFHFKALGHEAHDFLVDVHPLQAAWAREHGARRFALSLAGRVPGRAGVQVARAVDRKIAVDQIADFDPDVVFCHNLDFFTRAELDQLRGQGWLVAGQIASPMPAWNTVEGFDVVYTSFPHFVERIRAHGVQSEYLQLAFDERLPALIPESDPRSERPDDVVFVGGVNPNVHPAGTALLERVCERWPVAVYGYGQEALPPSSAILRNYRGEAWGLGMYRTLARAKVALNRHIDVAEGHANNMRLYEATGMGAALLTDGGSNLADILEPDVEVEVYDGGDDLIAKIEALRADEERRIGIAAQGHERTLRDHTWEKRIVQLAEMLERMR